MGTGRVQAHGSGTPCPGSYPREWSPRVPCTLQTVGQGPLLLQLWKGKSSPPREAGSAMAVTVISVPSGF